MLLVMFLIGVLFIPGVQSKTKSYYSGDAIIYNGELIVGSTNMGGLELFKLSGDKLVRLSKIRSFRAQYSGFDDFYDLAFNQEAGKLYVYLVDGKFLYKYDISDIAHPVLVSQISDNSWDYFLAVEKSLDKILTVGLNNSKLWNNANQVIDTFNVVNKTQAYNVNYSKDGDYLVNINRDKLQVYSLITRGQVAEASIFINNEHNRKSFKDKNNGIVYVVDDSFLRKINLGGELLDSFKHKSTLGYDVDGLDLKNHLYFSDGIGIVKFNKDNLEPIKWVYTGNLGQSNGWAMGLKVVGDALTEKVVVFNNSSILVLDENLKLLANYNAIEEDTNPEITESLFLSVDKNHSAANSEILLHGGGYGAGENLTITFADKKFAAKADGLGRFSTFLIVPSVLPGGYDIKVIGAVSGQSYSLGFKIE